MLYPSPHNQIIFLLKNNGEESYVAAEDKFITLLHLMEAIPQYPVLQSLYFARQQPAGLLVLNTVQAKRARKMLPNCSCCLNSSLTVRRRHWPALYGHGSSPLSERGASRSSNGSPRGSTLKWKCSRTMLMASGILRIAA